MPSFSLRCCNCQFTQGCRLGWMSKEGRLRGRMGYHGTEPRGLLQERGSNGELFEGVWGSGGLWGVSSRRCHLLILVSQPTLFPGLHMQSITSSPHPGMAQEHRCSQNSLLRWSRHPQTRPASRRGTSSTRPKYKETMNLCKHIHKLEELRWKWWLW